MKTPVKIRKVNKPCSFCTSKTVPVWADYEKLMEFLSSRGRILPRVLTGTCVAHQKKLMTAVKRARHLGLMPFSVGL